MPFLETAKKVIELATAIRAYWDRELPKHHSDYPLVNSGESVAVLPPKEQGSLEEILSKLPDDEIYQLGLVAYLGRGDFRAERLAENFQRVKDKLGDRQSAIARLVHKTALGDLLADGLDELGRHKIDPNRLNVASVSSAA